jgi:hypothetical protein
MHTIEFIGPGHIGGNMTVIGLTVGRPIVRRISVAFPA